MVSRLRQREALVWAFVAVVMWSGFAALVVTALRSLNAITVLVWSYLFAAVTSTAIHRARRFPWREAFIGPRRLVGIGLLGVLGWAGGTVIALDRGPVLEANLVTYLWPLLIVLLAPLAGEAFSRRYLVAAGVGLGGTVLVVSGGRSVSLTGSDAFTYLIAAGAALGWALYTVLLRRSDNADRHTALFVNWALAISLTIAVGTGTLELPSPGVLALCAAIGVGPLAVAFAAWDRAVTLTSVARVGVFSYLDPLLSTVFVVIVLDESLGPATAAGMILITGAAIIAERQAVNHTTPGG